MTRTELLATDALSTARHLFVDGLPAHFERLDWDAATLRALQTARLRELLATAIAKSPYHARRLRGIDPARFELDDLPSLPVMTKPDMMANYDDVPTDRRLTAGAVAAHLTKAGPEAELFLDEYLLIASGGSSGVRGMFALSCVEAAEFVSGVLRPGIRQVAARAGWPLPGPVPLLIVAAPTGMHATRAINVLLDGTIAATSFAPATLPFEEILKRAAEARPALIAGYPSTLARLADAQAAGQIHLEPQMIISTSEQLKPEHSARIVRGFGMPPSNGFASSEGLVGSAPPGSDVFAFASDLAIIEFVDEHDRPVAAGTPAHHVLVTNLFNRTQPLIRYRLDDQMTAASAPGNSAHQHASLSGRTDDYLRLDGVLVHPLTIRSALLRHPMVTEYQVFSRSGELRVDVVANGPIDLANLEIDVTRAIEAAGASGVEVRCREVEQIARDPGTGKARLFVTAGAGT